MRIGFIGLGNMGGAMCRHLLAAGHTVTAYARGERSRARAVELGVGLSASPAQLAADSQVVFTCVTATADVESVALGADGIIHGARPGTVLVDTSTISPAATRRIAEALRARSVAMLDAPVSGGVAGAEAATLTIFVGGEREAFERVCPLLENLGRTIFFMGPHGAGQATKLANQIAQLACLQGAAEALFFAASQGVDPARVREAVMTGFGASRMLDLLGKKMVERDFAAGIVAALHHKDLGVAIGLAHDAGFPLPITAQILQQLNALMGSGWGGMDTSALLLVLEQMAGRAKDRNAVSGG